MISKAPQGFFEIISPFFADFCGEEGGSFDHKALAKFGQSFPLSRAELWPNFRVKFPRWWGRHVARGIAMPSKLAPTVVLSLWAAVHG